MTVAGPVLLVSPHCDDGVFACGDVLAGHPGAVVVTVFAGGPRPAPAVTRWDAAGGFRDGDDVMVARRAEDRRALEELGALPVWLPFLDAQYGASPPAAEVAEALQTVVACTRPASVLAPLGLFHSDHRLTHEACLLVRAGEPFTRWLLYEDAIYRRIDDLASARLADLRAAGLRLTVLSTGRPASPRKRRAVAAYRSQLRALALPGHPGVDDVFAPERLWRVEA